MIATRSGTAPARPDELEAITVKPCDTCGNEYDQAFDVTTADGTTYTFDSIECAAHKIGPVCDHCGCKILGHGIQAGSQIFCCAACARHAGADEARDRV